MTSFQSVFQILQEDEVLDKEVQKNSYNGKAFKPFYSPRTVSELVGIKEFSKILENGFIFMHHRKDSMLHLTNELLKFHNNTLNEYHENTHDKHIKELVKNINKKSENNENNLWIIDIAKESYRISRNYDKLLRLKPKNAAIFIRSNVETISLDYLEFFDVIFLFNMSDGLFSKLKSFISISDSDIETLKSGVSSQGEPVLVFINYNKKRQSLPYFSKNPFIVDCESSLVVNSGKIEDRKMSIYNINSVQGSVGDGAKVEGSTFNQIQQNSKNLDMRQLAIELALLKDALKNNTSTESKSAIIELSNAEDAALDGNESKVFHHLKAVGHWVWDVAQKIAVPVVIEAIKKSM
jgi:hypothetical protein